MTWLTSPLSKRNTAPFARGSGIQTSGRYKVAAAWPLRRRWPKSFWVGQRWFGCRDELMNEHFIAIFVWYEMTTEKFTEGEVFYSGGIWSTENWVWEVHFFWGVFSWLENLITLTVTSYRCFSEFCWWNFPLLNHVIDQALDWPWQTQAQDACHFAPFLAADL